MELTTIDMPREQAEEAFKEYRHAVRSAKVASTNSEDAQIMRAYKALAEGKQVLNLDDAFATAGYDDAGLPRLAISRADYKTIQLNMTREYRWQSGRSGYVATGFEMWPSNEMTSFTRRREGIVFLRPLGDVVPADDLRRYSVVPNIPPPFRPPHALTNYHILWEPKWLPVARPPRDPALLKHLGGPLYAVLAVWDLTDVEMAVLGITRGSNA